MTSISPQLTTKAHTVSRITKHVFTLSVHLLKVTGKTCFPPTPYHTLQHGYTPNQQAYLGTLQALKINWHLRTWCLGDDR